MDLTAPAFQAEAKEKAKAVGCRCEVCPLRDEPGPVLPEKAHGARFTVLGEAAGPEEVKHGRPFVGSRAKIFDYALRKAGLARRDLWLQNAVMCQPPKGDMKKLLARIRSINAARRKKNTAISRENKKRVPAEQEPLLALMPTPQECCRPAVLHLLKQGAPKHILAAGKDPSRALLGGDPSIQAIRGSILDGNLVCEPGSNAKMQLFAPEAPTLGYDLVMRDVRIVPALSVGLVFVQRRWMDTLVRDIDRLVRWSKNALKWRPPDVIYNPDAETLRQFLAGPGPLTYDLETDGIVALKCNVRCVGIGTPDRGVVVGTRSRFTKGPPGQCPVCQGYGQVPAVKGDWASMQPCVTCRGEGRIDREDRTFYSSGEMGRVKAVLRDFFGNPKKLKIGHNAGYYDRLVIRQWLGVEPNPTLDTILLHRLAESELPHSLGFVGSKYTDVHSWKADRSGRKIATEAETDKELHVYCLAEGTQIMLADGTRRPIETIVRNRQEVEVLSHWGGRVQGCKVTDWFYTQEDNVDWWQIKFKDPASKRGLVCTADHGVYVRGHGLVEAKDLRPGMRVLHHESLITEHAKRALVGTLLGDTHLSVSPAYRDRPYGAATAYVHGGHAEASTLAQHKCQQVPALILGDVQEGRKLEINGRHGFAGPFRHFRSLNMHQLADLIPLVLDERGKHKICVEALDYMGDVGLAWLYMDDGCVQRYQNPNRSETCVLSLQRYPREQLEVMRAWLIRKFGSVYLGKDKVLRFTVPASLRFARAIARYVPDALRHKLPKIRGVEHWPLYVDIVKLRYRAASDREIVSAEPYHFDQTKKHQRCRSRRRYCLGVAGPNNFFTSAGLVSNCGLDVAVTARIVAPLTEDVKKVKQETLIAKDHQVQQVCADMHHVGMFVDLEEQKRTELATTKKLVSTRKKIQALANKNDFNPASTQQLRKLLFVDWKLTPPLDDDIRFTATGDPSTSDPILRSLLSLDHLKPEQRKFIFGVRRYRSLLKELGTYVVKLQPMSVEISDLGWDEDEDFEARQERKLRGYAKKGIVWADGRMRPGYNAHVAVTGRLSSSQPINAQNFPKHLRRLIVPQPGNVLVGADYDQLELRIAAARWGMKQYLQAFSDGWDPHTSVTALSVFGQAFTDAAMKLGLPFPWMSGTKFKGDANDMRQLAKIIQYAYQYKASVETGARIIQSTEISDPDTGGTKLPYLKMPVRKVRQMRGNWLKGIPELERGWDREISMFRMRKFVQEPVHGRKRLCLDGENPNEIVNFPIQGSASALVNDAMIEIWRDIPLHKWGPGTGLITQTHDALVVECPKNKAQWVIDCINHHMNKTHPALPGVVFTAAAEVGMTWKEVG